MKSKFLGKVGVWLCNRYSPRPCTSVEIASSQQYVELMISVLAGTVPYYGCDRDEGFEPIVSVIRFNAFRSGE